MKQQDREMRQAIVEFLRRPGYRAATTKDLHRLLRIDRSRRHAFKRVLRDLISDGEVVKAGRDRYAPPSIRKGADGGRPEGKQPRRSATPGGARGQKLVSGRLQRHPRGFGFVVPDSGGPDLFVPPRSLGDLLDG